MAEYISTLTGPEMDQALMDMNNHVSEAWAVGTRGGNPVTSGDETYHNNAKYYAESITTTLAPAYDSTSTYAVGDLVTYQGVVYECTTAITTPEAFDPSNWQVFNLTALKAEIQAQMNTKAPIITDTASGAIASFPDGADSIPVESLISYINPLQDLHGQSNPYPAGGGKNKLNPSVDGGSSTVNTVTLSVSNQKFKLNGTASAAISRTALHSSDFTLPAGTYTISIDINYSGYGAIYLQNSGGSNRFDVSPYTFTITEDTTYNIGFQIPSGTAISNLEIGIQIEIGSATTFAPYSNICPISGYTEMNITRVGKNLFNKNTVTSGYYINQNGVIVEGADFCYSDLIPVISGDTYTFSGVNAASSSQRVRLHAYDKYGNWLSQFANVNATAGASYNIVESIPANTYAIRASMHNAVLPTAQYEKGSTATTYEAYNRTIYSISWSDEAGMVYYGTLEYLGNGEWKLTATYTRKDLGSLNWEKREDFKGFVCNYAWTDFYYEGAGSDKFATGIMDSYQLVANTTGKVNGTSILYWNTGNLWYRMFIYDDNAWDNYNAAGFKTYVTGKYIVYKLATPLVYTISGVNPYTLKGNNNWFADTNGNIDIEYDADTKLFILKVVGA